MMRFLALLLAVALPGCALEPPNSVPADTARGSGAVASLAGEWRVAGIDGQPFDEPYGLALSASDTEMWWPPKCAGYVRSYRLEGTRVRFAPVPRPNANDGRPAPVCLVAIPARLGDVFAAIDGSDRAVRTPSNGIEISGGGHSLLLFSQ